LKGKESMLDVNKLYHKLLDTGRERADAHAAFKVLEDTEKSVLAEHTQKFIINGAKSQASAESQARASAEFVEFLKEKGRLRHEFGIKDVEYESIKVYIDMLRANQALERAQIGVL